MVLTAGLVGVVFGQAASSRDAALPGTPVLVELFTSEGCSDCPPADALLARLEATQFVPGAHAIVLSEHVTYWNHLGWRDPFSFEEMTERQEEYRARFGLESSYTPQMVVDGSMQFVGSDAGALRNAVARAAAAPKAKLALEDVRWTGKDVRFAVRGPADAGAKLVAVLAENAAGSEAARGENAGRILHHVAVVRILKEFGPNADDGRPLRLSATTLAGGQAATHTFRLVVFLADGKTGQVLAVAERTLNP